jgi:hypothetical protein
VPGLVVLGFLFLSPGVFFARVSLFLARLSAAFYFPTDLIAE